MRKESWCMRSPFLPTSNWQKFCPIHTTHQDSAYIHRWLVRHSRNWEKTHSDAEFWWMPFCWQQKRSQSKPKKALMLIIQVPERAKRCCSSYFMNFLLFLAALNVQHCRMQYCCFYKLYHSICIWQSVTHYKWALRWINVIIENSLIVCKM